MTGGIKNDAVILVACNRFGVNRPKQTKVFSNSDLDTWVAIQSCTLMQATHTPSLVSIGQSKLKLLSGNWISILVTVDLYLYHSHLGSNPKLCLDVSYTEQFDWIVGRKIQQMLFRTGWVVGPQPSYCENSHSRGEEEKVNNRRCKGQSVCKKILIKFPLKRKGCQVLSVLIVL